MVALGLVALVVELLLVLPPYLRLTKRLNDLNLLYEEHLGRTRDELQNLSLAIEETRLRLRPYRRLRKWLQHPLTLALFASYQRRARLRRSVGPAR